MSKKEVENVLKRMKCSYDIKDERDRTRISFTCDKYRGYFLIDHSTDMETLEIERPDVKESLVGYIRVPDRMLSIVYGIDRLKRVKRLRIRAPKILKLQDNFKQALEIALKTRDFEKGIMELEKVV